MYFIYIFPTTRGCCSALSTPLPRLCSVPFCYFYFTLFVYLDGTLHINEHYIQCNVNTPDLAKMLICIRSPHIKHKKQKQTVENINMTLHRKDTSKDKKTNTKQKIQNSKLNCAPVQNLPILCQVLLGRIALGDLAAF